MSEFTYAKISVTGADAFEFLQAQLTADLNILRSAAEITSVRSAWCNPKGRVICIPTVSKLDNGYELSLPADLADLVVQKMTLFRFRSKVEFEVQPGRTMDAATAAQQIREGVPEIALAQSEKFTAHMLNLDLLGIVSLDKGCYPGQEIVARTHYRGVSKRRCMRFRGNIPAAPGDKISDSDREIGEVVNAIGNDLLAVIPVASANSVLAIGTDRLTPVGLPYAL
jgi:folate-binding protein YgfZ